MASGDVHPLRNLTAQGRERTPLTHTYTETGRHAGERMLQGPRRTPGGGLTGPGAPGGTQV